MKNYEPAYPFTGQGRDSCGEVVPQEQFSGMTIRDYFAATAINAIVIQCRGAAHNMAVDAYEIADAMMQARDAAELKETP